MHSELRFACRKVTWECSQVQHPGGREESQAGQREQVGSKAVTPGPPADPPGALEPSQMEARQPGLCASTPPVIGWGLPLLRAITLDEAVPCLGRDSAVSYWQSTLPAAGTVRASVSQGGQDGTPVHPLRHVKELGF